MTVEKNNENINNQIDKKILLEELAKDIASEFGIEKQKAEELIKKETIKSIESLKTELENTGDSKDNLKQEDIEKLFYSLEGARKIIENSSKLEIKVLKDDIENPSNAIEDFKNRSERYLPPKLIERAKNPTAPHEHILGFALGTLDTFDTTVSILYGIGKGIISTPYHLWMIVSGKGKTNSFKDI